MMLEREKRREREGSVVESSGSGAEDEYFDRRGEGL
jgi:hypothetical protein